MLNRVIFLLIAITISISNAQAGSATVGGTRLIYNADQSLASIAVKNPDESPYLIQSWVTKTPESQNGEDSFITTPPLFRLDAKSENAVRVVYNGKTPLPQDRESLFWLNIKSIPSTSQSNDKNMLVIAVKTQIKLFYRPTGLKGNPNMTYKQLQFINTNGKLVINNPTPFVISLNELLVNGTKVPEQLTILPFSDQPVKFNVKTGDKVSWKAINDYGGVTAAEIATVSSK